MRVSDDDRELQLLVLGLNTGVLLRTLRLSEERGTSHVRLLNIENMTQLNSSITPKELHEN
jgi:hypothetical protein